MSTETFQQRTGFPSQATYESLKSKGARKFISADEIPYNGRTCRIEQMHLGDVSEGFVYVWKRIVAVDGTEEDRTFQIHAEISNGNMRHYNYVDAKAVA